MMRPERKEEFRGIPKRLRDYEQYADACDDAADAIEELLAALDEAERDVPELAREVVEAARKARRAMEVMRYEDNIAALFTALKRHDELRQ